MGKTNLIQCDGPFPHPTAVRNRRVSKFLMSADLRQEAQTKYPTHDWKKVRYVCIQCKNRIISINKWSKKKQGRKKKTIQQHDSTDGSNLTISPSGLPISAHSPPAQYNGDAQPNALHDDEDNEDMRHLSQESANACSLAESSQNSIYTTSIVSGSQASSVENTDTMLEDLNVFLGRMHISPITKTTLHRPCELRKVWQSSVTYVNDKFNKLTYGKYGLQAEAEKECEYCDTLFLDMCHKYRQAVTRKERYQILTSLPGRFTSKDISRESGCTYYAALKASELKALHGCFSFPPPLVGRKLSQDLVNFILAFYHDDRISRPSPRMNDTINGPNKSRVAKRHMLMNQAETLAFFKEENPEKIVGRSKFLALCPRECIWPKTRPFHNVCVCITHSNFKFMHQAIGSAVPFKNFVASLQCQPISQLCAFGLCPECPKMDIVYNLLETIQDQEITYSQWTQTDGTDLQNLTVPAEDFKQAFLGKLTKFLQHDFIKIKQQEYIKYIKEEGLKQPNFLLIVVDFAQNYSMVIQDAVQSYHWNGKQATVHPFSVFWFDQAAQKLLEKHYVVISDEMVHDTNTFNCFKRKVVSQIKVDFEEFNPKHIIYQSDGAGGQYKNYKNLAHLAEHFVDFQITAEWIFSASGHGKGPCDRIASVVKSTTRIHSLKQGNYVLSPKDMYDFCTRKLANEKMSFLFITKEEVAAHRVIFEERYRNARRLPGTRAFHHFVPTNNGRIELRKFCGSVESQTFSLMRDFTLLVNFEEVNAGDILCFVEAGSIQIGMFIEHDEEFAEISCMKATRQHFHLRWPAIPSILRVALIDVLMVAPDPILHPGGRFFTYSEEQLRQMYEKLDEWYELRN